MPREITSERESEMTELFSLYDKDGSGTVNGQELGTLLRAMGLAPSNAQVQSLLQKYDTDNSNDLKMAEFRKFYEDDTLPEASENVDAMAMFNAFDADRTGKVSRKELTEALSTNKETLTKGEIDGMFARGGCADNESLDYDQFVAVVFSGLPTPRTAKREVWAKLKERLPTDRNSPEQRQRRYDLFKEFDINGTGHMSLGEVNSGCRNILHLDDLTDDLTPITKRAYAVAKGVSDSSSSTDDAYVQRSEFRILFAYIKLYFECWVMFDEVDGSNDRRINLEEFKAATPKLAGFGVNVTDPEEEFKKIDTNDGGVIVFDEFADWACRKGLDADGKGSDSDLETDAEKEAREKSALERLAAEAASKAEEAVGKADDGDEEEL